MKPARSAKPNAPRHKSRGGFLLGMFVGLFLGLAVALGIAFYLNKTPIPFMQKKPAAEKPADAGKAPAIAGMPASKAPAGEKPKFDFYKILPGGEEPVSDKELKAAAKSAGEASKDVFLLQAGSFQNPADADNRKAQLAILGFEAAVEPITLPEKGTWYRVRLGPYTRIDELNKARSTLAQNGIDVSLVKLKDPASAKAN
ncbi:MAG: SPOR domain-containing protein [Betaproteobacteria bacterium]|nr:SPOR domain-containing protein [Betaproteobacteria bacterium]